VLDDRLRMAISGASVGANAMNQAWSRIACCAAVRARAVLAHLDDLRRPGLAGRR
jgi:hypothetical protein